MRLQTIAVFLLVLLLICCWSVAADPVQPDGSLYLTLSVVKGDGSPIPNSFCGGNETNVGFLLDILSVSPNCSCNGTTTVTASLINDTMCEFVLDPGMNSSSALVPCFAGIIQNVPSISWTSFREALNISSSSSSSSSSQDVNITVMKLMIGNFEPTDSGGGEYTYDVKMVLVGFAGIFVLVFFDAFFNAGCWRLKCAQCVSVFVIYAAVVFAILLYLSYAMYQPTPIISSSYPLSVESCYVRLRDFAPWDPGFITEIITMNDAHLSFTSLSSSVIDRWPCAADVYYNPYHVVFDGHGNPIPLTVTLTASTLVVESSLSATYVPLIVSSTAHQLKANRVYLQNASFFSISVSLYSGIAYVSNSVTDPSQKIELNTTSVFVATGETQNPKALTVRHTSNPPLFCLGPDVLVDYNASQCSGGTGSSTDDGPTAAGGGGIAAGGNESFKGFSGFCSLSATDTFPNLNASIVLGPIQAVHIRCVSVYALPSTTAPIYNKTIGLGFSYPAEISEAVRGALNASGWAIGNGMYTDYVQSVELVTPLLGAQMLNTNNPSLLEFFPELMVWFTGFVLSPPYRTLQVVPNHFTCGDDISMANLVPPRSNLITYLHNDDLSVIAERFVDKVLYPIFNQVSQYPQGGLTSYQLPFEAAQAFPAVPRHTFDDGVSVDIERPMIADFLIFLSSMLSLMLLGGISVILWITWSKLYAFMTLKQKQVIAQSTQKHLEPSSSSSSSTSSGSASTSGSGAAMANARNKALRLYDSAEAIVRIVNGFSYRIACMIVHFIQGLYTDDDSFRDFVIEYCEFGSERVSSSSNTNALASVISSEAISVEDFSLYYRSFCRIFDRIDQRTYRSEKDLLHTLSKIVPDSKVQVRWGKLVGVSWRAAKSAGKPGRTLFKKHIDQVVDMFELNNVNYAFMCMPRARSKWYDRFVRHPVTVNNIQAFVYCFVFLLPIWFAMFALFSLQMAMAPYQIYGVNFLTSQSEAAYLPSLEGNTTMQFVLLWAAYVTLGGVAFERLLHSVMQVKCLSDSVIFSLPRALLRFFLSMIYLLSCLFCVGYVFLVCLWWILTCFLAPNAMIPFAASAISFMTSLFGVYKSLRSCKTKLSEILRTLISKEVARFLGSIRVVVGDDGMTITTRGGDRKKEIASATKIPLAIVEFAAAPDHQQGASKDTKLDAISVLSPSGSKEFIALMNAFTNPTGDVDDPIEALQPYLDLLDLTTTATTDPLASLEEKSCDDDDAAGYVSPSLIVDTVRSLLSASSKSKTRDFDMDKLRSAVVQTWHVNVLASIDGAAAAATAPASQSSDTSADAADKLGGLRRVVGITAAFLHRRQFDVLCRSFTQILFPLVDAFPSEALAEWQTYLPILHKLSWLLDDTTAFTASLPTYEMCLNESAAEQVQDKVQAFIAKKLERFSEKKEVTAAATTMFGRLRGGGIKKQASPVSEGADAYEMMEEGLNARLITEEKAPNNESARPPPAATQQNQKTSAPSDGTSGDPDVDEVIDTLVPLGQSDDSVWSIDVNSVVVNDDKGRDKFKSLPLLRRWVYCLLLGREWPSVDFTTFLPAISSRDFRTITMYSLAGINPTSFTEVTGWVSTSHPSIHARELSVTALIVSKCKSYREEAAELLKYAPEAWYYPIVKDHVGSLDDGIARDHMEVLQQCLEVSCPQMTAWIKGRSGSGPMHISNVNEFFQVHNFFDRILDSLRRVLDMDIIDTQQAPPPPGAATPLDTCRAHRTPLHLLSFLKPNKEVPKSAAAVVDEVRRATGVQVWMTTDGTSMSTSSTVQDKVSRQRLLLVEAVCAACVMQHALPVGHPVWKTLLAMSSRGRDKVDGGATDNSSATAAAADDALQDEDILIAHSIAFPLCRLLAASSIASTDDVALAKARCLATVAAAYRRSEPLYASLAVAMYLPQTASNVRVVWSLCERVSSRIFPVVQQQQPLQASSSDDPTSSVRFFFTSPSLLLNELLQSESLQNQDRLQVALAMFDSVGAYYSSNALPPNNSTTNTNEKMISFAQVVHRTPISYTGLGDCLRLVVLGRSEDNNTKAIITNATTDEKKDRRLANLAILECVLACATSSQLQDVSIVETAMTALDSVFHCKGVQLVARRYMDAAKYFCRSDRDTFGTIRHCILPMLSTLSPACKAHAEQCSYLIAHAVKLHHHKRRGPSLLEILRMTVVRSLNVQPNGPLEMGATPVDEWGVSLQDFVATKDINKLKRACQAAGLQGSDDGWLMLQRYIEATNSSEKSSSKSSTWASAMSSAFTANLQTIPQEQISSVLKKLKKMPIFAPLADSLEEQLSGTTTLESLS